ncbi:MAG TPA: hypothetical protein VHW60_06005, partial [Caulobacteraceae bacterium]|nr:hypothetical protein [Caulobacteraceae bacterium]
MIATLPSNCPIGTPPRFRATLSCALAPDLRTSNGFGEVDVDLRRARSSSSCEAAGASRETDAMIPTITAFERSPDGGMGLARDTRVRWAL